jgi:hypothetical protein
VKRIAQMKTNFNGKTGLNEAIGGRELCAWQPARGLVWVQVRDPRHARRLGKREDGRLVVRGVAGGYLRTFEFRDSLAWAARLIKRYLAYETTANEGLGSAACPVASQGAGSDMGRRMDVPACCEA